VAGDFSASQAISASQPITLHVTFGCIGVARWAEQYGLSLGMQVPWARVTSNDLPTAMVR